MLKCKPYDRMAVPSSGALPLKRFGNYLPNKLYDQESRASGKSMINDYSWLIIIHISTIGAYE
jgi:hypothetical protein